MLGKKNKEFKEGFDTLLGINSTFEGNIKCEGSIRIDGKLKGDIDVKGDVYVGPEGFITGNISAHNVHLCGKIEGNIHSDGLLKIHSTAKLHGDIKVKNFVADEGALFDGNCSMIKSDTDRAVNNTKKTHTQNGSVNENYNKNNKNRK